MGNPLIHGALVAATLGITGCAEDSEANQDPSADMYSSMRTDMEVIAPMPPPMVMPDQDSEMLPPMIMEEEDASVIDSDEGIFAPMPSPNEDMEVRSDAELPPMPPPEEDMEVRSDAELPPMPPPQEDMRVRPDAEEPPMPPPMPPPPMPPPRGDEPESPEES